MSVSKRDCITGLVLLAFGLIWSGLVYWTIPAGQGDGSVGPRAFPLLLGVLLSALAALMIVRSLQADGDKDNPADKSESEAPRALSWLEVKMTVGVFLLLGAYGFLMEKTGFLIATVIVVLIALAGLLGLRRPVPVLVFAFSISVGCWLIFNKLLGTYLPLGSWVSIG